MNEKKAQTLVRSARSGSAACSAGLASSAAGARNSMSRGCFNGAIMHFSFSLVCGFVAVDHGAGGRLPGVALLGEADLFGEVIAEIAFVQVSDGLCQGFGRRVAEGLADLEFIEQVS